MKKGYWSYTFVTDKDPVIDEIRDIIMSSGQTVAKVAEFSGVSAVTIYGWLYGNTKRPQNATVEAVFRALGYERMAVEMSGNVVPIKKRKGY